MKKIYTLKISKFWKIFFTATTLQGLNAQTTQQNNTQQPIMMAPGSQVPPQQMIQIPPIMSTTVAPSTMMNMQNPNFQQAQALPSMMPQQFQQIPMHQSMAPQQQPQQQQPQMQQISNQAPTQQTAPPPAQQPPAEPEKPKEVETAELISFD